MKREAEKINSTEERCHSNVPERFREPLMKVAAEDNKSNLEIRGH